jgi:hypothetical protein
MKPYIKTLHLRIGHHIDAWTELIRGYLGASLNGLVK